MCKSLGFGTLRCPAGRHILIITGLSSRTIAFHPSWERPCESCVSPRQHSDQSNTGSACRSRSTTTETTKDQTPPMLQSTGYGDKEPPPLQYRNPQAQQQPPPNYWEDNYLDSSSSSRPPTTSTVCCLTLRDRFVLGSKAGLAHLVITRA